MGWCLDEEGWYLMPRSLPPDYKEKPGNTSESAIIQQAPYTLKNYSSIISKTLERLVIQLKRFTVQNTKIETLVQMPEILLIDEFKFQLMAFIIHIGDSAGGHYYSLVRKNER